MLCCDVYGCTAYQRRHPTFWRTMLSDVPNTAKKILVSKLATLVEHEIRRLCAEKTWTRGAFTIQPDHVHVFLSAPPSVVPSDIAHQLEGTTARKAFQHFPDFKKQLWGGALWSRSYYVGSVGDMSMDAVLQYIELGQD